jgi:PAS domain S-box-containing protein
MDAIESGTPELRFLVLAPTRKDGTLTCSVLERAGIACRLLKTLDDACDELESGAAGLLLAEETLVGLGGGRLMRWLRRQPAWSDLPVLLVARSGADSTVIGEATELLGNTTVLERPTRIASLVTAARSALRARHQQYRVRDHLNERARASRIESLLAAVVASSDDAIISKTLEGNILTWNAGAERLFGYAAGETIGKSILLLIPPELHAEEADLLRRLRRGERIEHYETVRVTKDGRRRDVSLTLSPVFGEDGRIIAASKVARDVTQQKQAEAALREADRRKDEFLAVLAHELRNPLAPIRNSLHILRLTGRLDGQTQQVTDIMERQVNHMVRLVDDLLEISRITRGMIELRKEQLDIGGIIRGAVETSRPLIEAGRHELELELPEEALMVEGDSVRLAQVFANLLNNAAKYTDPGGRILVSAASDGHDVVVKVRDNGVGIPADKLARVFDLFVQADRNTERGRGGLGIGLTLAKWLVEMHGGTIGALSGGEGQGSEFVVRLPRSAVQRGARARSTSEQPVAQMPRRRVLVVDDNVDAAESMGMLLKLLHADTRVVHNGPDALAAMGSYQPRVVLLDIGMPGMDGHEVARRIRQRPDGHAVTLIALTGWGQEQDRQRTMAAGFDFHLVKPADINALRALLTSIE